MKKLMVIAIFTAAAFAAMAEVKPLDGRTCTAEEVSQAVEAVLAATNAVDAGQVGSQYKLWEAGRTCSWRGRSELAEVFADADRRIAAKFDGQFGSSTANISWPLCTAAKCRRYYAPLDEVWPEARALWRKYSRDVLSMGLHGAATFDENIVILNEKIKVLYTATNLPRWGVSTHEIGYVKKSIQRKAEAIIKRGLRKRGRSFVTKDGVNPCEEQMQSLTTALNAPNFDGLNQWLEYMGIAARLDTSHFLPESEVSALKDAVMYGDKAMDGRTMSMLLVALGVDGYNAFVKEYNGD